VLDVDGHVWLKARKVPGLVLIRVLLWMMEIDRSLDTVIMIDPLSNLAQFAGFAV
jgi:hypothetical protein